MQGSESAEVQAVRAAEGEAEGGTAYLNLETGDCHGDDVSVRALIQSGLSRVVVGLQNPLRHCRGLAIKVCMSRGYCMLIAAEFSDAQHQISSLSDTTGQGKL